VPLVFTSLILGVASFGDVGRLGRIGVRTILCFLALTAMAATLGLILVDIAKPGLLIEPQTRADLIARYGTSAQIQAGPRFGIDNLVQIVPRNPLDAESPSAKSRPTRPVPCFQSSREPAKWWK
jgi:Na+/H+-dicarboxylate symporter